MINNNQIQIQEQLVLVFDTETTGLIKGPRPRALEQYPYITQITAILYSAVDKKIVSVLNEYVSLPDGVIIDPVISELTGITNEICNTRGKPIEDILLSFCELVLTSKILVAHNYEFDSEVLQAELYRCSGKMPKYYAKIFDYPGRPCFCTMKNSVDFCNLKTAGGKQKYPRLIELYRSLFGLSPIVGSLHNSAVDTLICLRCFLKLQYQITVPDVEFAEKMTLLSNIGPQMDEKKQGVNAISISARTRQRFPL